MRSQFISLVFELLRARGSGDVVDKLVRELALPDPAADDVPLPLDTYRAASDRAADLGREPFLGLRIAQAVPRGIYGLGEFATRSAPDTLTALDRLRRYVRLVNDALDVDITSSPAGRVDLVMRVPGEPLCLGRHANEYALAFLVRVGRELTGVDLVPDEVHFAHPAPHDTSALVQHFRTRHLRFGTGVNRLVLDAQLVPLPLRSADHALLAWLDRQAEASLPGAVAHEPVRGMRDQIRRDLTAGTTPTLESLAAALRLSARTLQRRLRDGGSSFRDELDTVRERMAIDLLERSKLPVLTIAERLGYADQNTFERAFRRWQGVTPSAYRRQRRQPTVS